MSECNQHKSKIFFLYVLQDVGCGVGGPMREIVRLSGAHVTGINNNAYQIERCKTYSKKFGLESMTDFVKVSNH